MKPSHRSPHWRRHQDLFVNPQKRENETPRDSWWTVVGREDFTAVARVMVKPELVPDRRQFRSQLMEL